jgi:hypothetical protein
MQPNPLPTPAEPDRPAASATSGSSVSFDAIARKKSVDFPETLATDERWNTCNDDGKTQGVSTVRPVVENQGTDDMKRTSTSIPALALATIAALSTWMLSSGVAYADDTPSPCAALRRIVAAAPGGFASLHPEDGRSVAQPYGDDAQCNASRSSYQCLWTPRQDAGSSADALQAVAADIASCLPEATHDGNSPARQHFYLGARDQRTQITATTADANRLKLVVSGK